MPSGLADDTLRAMAWALKDEAYAAWSSDPRQAATAAAVLKRLQPMAEAPALQAELHALAEWLDAVVELTCGRMAEAVAALDRASRPRCPR